MRAILLVGVLLAATVTSCAQSTAPAVAQAQSPQPCLKLSDLEAQFAASGTKFVELTAGELLGVATPDLGKIVVFDANDVVAIGFEVDGCMSAPLGLAASLKTSIGS